MARAGGTSFGRAAGCCKVSTHPSIVLHSYHQEVKKVIDAAQGSWERFKEGMQRKYRLGDGLLTTTDLEAMNKEDFTTIGAFVQEFKKRARKVHGISEEAQCAIFLGLLTVSEAVELTRHGGGSTKLTWATIDRGVEVGCLDQVEQRQVRLQRQKREERDATASGTPGVTRIVTDVLAQLGYAIEPVVQRRVVTAVKVKGKEPVIEEAGQEELWEEEEPVPQHLTKEGEAVENTPPVDGFLDQEEDVRLHINKWSPRVPSCVGYPIWQAPKGYERRNELVLKPFKEEDPWGGKDVQWMMELAMASSHSLVEDMRTIEEGPGQVERHEDLMGGMYLLVNTLLQESLDQSDSLNPTGNVDEISESQDDEFEEGEIKEAFRAEEYDGIYLELGFLLSCEMRLRDASDRAQRMLQRYLVRDGHLFVRREVGNPMRVVCGRNRQIDVVATLHDDIAGGHRGVGAIEERIKETSDQVARSLMDDKARWDQSARVRKVPLAVGDVVLLYDTSLKKQWSRMLDKRWSDFTKTAMPRGGKGTRPPQRPLGASGGYERHGPRQRESTPVYNDGDIELFLDSFWEHARRMGWTVTQAIERLRGAGRFEEPIARIRRETTTRQEVEIRMEELRPSPVRPNGRLIRLKIGNVSDFIPAFEWFMQEQGIQRDDWMQTLPLWTRKAERPLAMQIRDMARDWESCRAHLREAFRRPELPQPRVERRQRSQRPRDPEPREARPSRGGRKALARREQEPEDEERGAYPDCGLGPVEFHRFTEGGLRRSPAHTQGEPPASEGPLRELKMHLDISRWRASLQGEGHGEQAKEVPREEVPQEEVRGTQRERGLGDKGRCARKEVIEVGEDTPPQTPTVGLRLGDAPGSTRQANEGLQREETPLPSSEKAPSPEGREERRRERAVVRREALILIDRHLAAHALEHPDLEEPAPAEPRQESCQPEKEMEAEIPKRIDLRTRERVPAGETTEEKRARRTRRIDEIWQERQRLEAAGELPEQQQERQRSEAAGALPGQAPSAPAKALEISEMWRDFWEQRGEELPSPVRAGFGVARKAEERLDQPRQEPPMGRVILEPEEARAQRQAERETFEFRAPTELATLPVAAADPVVPLAVEEGLPPSSSEPAQGSAEGSMGVLLEAVHTIQEEVSLFSPEQRIEEPLEREMGIEEEGVIEGRLQRIVIPEYGPEEIEEQPTAVPGAALERRPQRLDTPEYVPATEDLKGRLGFWATGSGSGGPVPGTERQEVVGTTAPQAEQQGVISTLAESPLSPPPQPRKKKFKRKVDQLCFYCKRSAHHALDCLEFLEDKATGKISEVGGKMYDRQGRIVEKSADGLRAQLYRQNQKELRR
ncbi:hypothetical protein CBR_g40844 [Chara braunii]|uniref:Uncharacterized protein n=1 Tax=Chara braunii TaxID=69332 RepID=A0A388K2A1_CHABU|nr:hypothetical protein CBR_g40844 [Chara braunii]|eukprot:GBG64145.1 hypothetical protein CBR_g40844 [Chara braunii]